MSGGFMSPLSKRAYQAELRARILEAAERVRNLPPSVRAILPKPLPKPALKPSVSVVERRPR